MKIPTYEGSKSTTKNDTFGLTQANTEGAQHLATIGNALKQMGQKFYEVEKARQQSKAQVELLDRLQKIQIQQSEDNDPSPERQKFYEEQVNQAKMEVLEGVTNKDARREFEPVADKASLTTAFNMNLLAKKKQVLQLEDLVQLERTQALATARLAKNPADIFAAKELWGTSLSRLATATGRNQDYINNEMDKFVKEAASEYLQRDIIDEPQKTIDNINGGHYKDLVESGALTEEQVSRAKKTAKTMKVNLESLRMKEFKNLSNNKYLEAIVQISNKKTFSPADIDAMAQAYEWSKTRKETIELYNMQTPAAEASRDEILSDLNMKKGKLFQGEWWQWFYGFGAKDRFDEFEKEVLQNLKEQKITKPAATALLSNLTDLTDDVNIKTKIGLAKTRTQLYERVFSVYPFDGYKIFNEANQEIEESGKLAVSTEDMDKIIAKYAPDYLKKVEQKETKDVKANKGSVEKPVVKVTL